MWFYFWGLCCYYGIVYFVDLFDDYEWCIVVGGIGISEVGCCFGVVFMWNNCGLGECFGCKEGKW